MTNVHMIGVNHLDPAGEHKLERLLRDLSPAIVLLEGSQSNYEAQITYLNAIKKEITRRDLDPEIARVFLAEQEPKGFGTRAARTYCAPTTPIYFEDSFEHRTEEEISHLAQRAVENMANYDKRSAEETLRTFRQSMTHVYELVAEALKSGEETTLWEHLTYRHIGDKDSIMERKLREVVAKNPEGKIVTVTGLKHIIKDPRQETFYSRIVDIDPKRSVLYSSDS